MQIVSIKTKLVFERESDKVSIIDTLKTARDVWNFISEQHFSVNSQGWLDCKNSLKELHAKVYFSSKEKFANCKAQMVIIAENSVLSTYRSMKSNKHRPTKPAKKKKLSMRLDANVFAHKGILVSLISLDKRIKCKFQTFARLEKYLAEYNHGDPTIFVRDNEVWISLPFKVEEPETKANLACGIDLGVCRFVATSEGKLFIDKKSLKEKRRLRYLKSQLQSKGTKSARRHLRRLSVKEKNKNLNFNHHLANAVVASTKANVLVLEDLNVSKMKTKKKYDKTTGLTVKTYGSKNRISQVSLSLLLFLITYKAKLAGKSVMLVNPAYTSQTNHLTGKVEGERKGRRFYAKGKFGSKGLVFDADINAAVNIAKLAELPISCGNVLDGQGTVICPIVCKSSSLV